MMESRKDLRDRIEAWLYWWDDTPRHAWLRHFTASVVDEEIKALCDVAEIRGII